MLVYIDHKDNKTRDFNAKHFLLNIMNGSVYYRIRFLIPKNMCMQ